MKRFFATSVMALMMGTAAIAQTQSTDQNQTANQNQTKAQPGSESMVMPIDTYVHEQEGDIYASNFIGMRVYAVEKDYDQLNKDTRIKEGVEKEWDDIGEVNDIILDRKGNVRAVILGIGGFLAYQFRNPELKATSGGRSSHKRRVRHAAGFSRNS